ncbi:MAG: M6 family metalloprotease domain-containing protein [Candidatus Firestonebacteria bacterium]
MKRVLIVICFIQVFLTFKIIVAVPFFASPPAPGVKVDKIPKDGVHKLPDVSYLRAMGTPASEIAKAIGTTGTKTLVVIFVNFSGTTFGGEEIASYTTLSTGYLDRLKAYITEISYGTLTLIITVKDNSGAGYSLSNSMLYYGSNNEAKTADGTLFNDALVAAGVNGGYDAVMVVHAGTGQESEDVNSNIWSMFVDWGSLKRGFREGTTVPAKELGSLKPYGVLCHEFGHQLGLPDLYNTDTGSSNVGKWDLMDYGAWVNNGDSPPHPSTWCKAFLSWVSPTLVNKASDLNINYFEGNSPSTFKIPILGSSTEYFLIEYRKQTGFDTNLPGQGVLIWHIDDTVGDIALNNINNDSNHLRVALKEADMDKDAGSNKGEGTDTYPTGSNIFTNPYSNGYSNISSSITIFDFSGLGSDTMTAKLSMISATTNLVLKNALNFPNPVKNVARTTIRVSFSRPFTTGNLKLYNLAGELILDNSLTSSEFNTQASQDNSEWIYDYVWDLKNSNGSLVGSGLYFYVVTAEIGSEKQVKTGKLAIIR